MVFLGSKRPHLTLVGAPVEKVLPLVTTPADQNVKSNTDAGLELLRGAKDFLNSYESKKFQLAELAFSGIKKNALKVGNILINHAALSSAREIHKCTLGSLLCKIGAKNHEVSKALEGLNSKNKTEKAYACKCIKKILAENANSFSKLKIIAEEAAILNKKTGKKIAGAEKLLANIERFEVQVEKLVTEVRGRLSIQTFRALDGEEKTEKKEAEKHQHRIIKLSDEDGSAPKPQELVSSEGLINSSIEYLQKVKELLVDIADVQQQIEFLESRAEPFEDAKPEVKKELDNLLRSERVLEAKMSYCLAQSALTSLN
jgi:hypothetical protein